MSVIHTTGTNETPRQQTVEEALRARVAELEANGGPNSWAALMARNAELLKENLVLKRDAARYRWLRLRNENDYDDNIDPAGLYVVDDSMGDVQYMSAKAIDAAIDEAMKS